MSQFLAVLLNDVAQLEYDRNVALTDYQAAYLESMDLQMDKGIEIDGESIENPELNQKVQFVSANLLNAMRSDNEGLTSALCSYLASRLPDLKQIKINDDAEGVCIDLVFDEDYGKQAFVSFSPKP